MYLTAFYHKHQDMKILIVDDEQDLCEILQYNLEVEGYAVECAYSAEEASVLPLADFDLILLDVMMGEVSGFQFAQQLKSNPATAHIPIIFITALDSEDHTVRGLNLGADDYIAKPLAMKEVRARIRAVLRRVGPQSQTAHSVSSATAQSTVSEGLDLSLEAKTVMLDGEKLPLTKLEFEMLALFLQNPNVVFSREELLRRCWPQDVFVLDRTVDDNITRLRKKLGRFGQQIKTRVGYGYTFEK